VFGILFTETQLQALEKARVEKEVHGEIETEHPGYLGSQDTYYVGTLKGVGGGGCVERSSASFF